jgi:hypothetical protein
MPHGAPPLRPLAAHQPPRLCVRRGPGIPPRLAGGEEGREVLLEPLHASKEPLGLLGTQPQLVPLEHHIPAIRLYLVIEG